MFDLVTAHIAVAARGLMSSCITPNDHPIILQKGTTVARMVAANEVPDTVAANEMVGSL